MIFNDNLYVEWLSKHKGKRKNNKSARDRLTKTDGIKPWKNERISSLLVRE